MGSGFRCRSRRPGAAGGGGFGWCGRRVSWRTGVGGERGGGAGVREPGWTWSVTSSGGATSRCGYRATGSGSSAGRPGLLGAAEVPEADRGGAGPRARPRACGTGCGGGRRARRAPLVPGRGHGRSPRRRRPRRVLLPGGRRADPGQHRVTEAITGLYIVAEQIVIAEGRPPRSGRRTSVRRPRDRAPDQRRGPEPQFPAEPGHGDGRRVPGRADRSGTAQKSPR